MILGAAVLKRLTVVASDVVVVLEVEVTRGVVLVALVLVLVVLEVVVLEVVVLVVVGAVLVGAVVVVVVLRRTAQDKQANVMLIDPSSQPPCRHIFIPEFHNFILCFHSSQILAVFGFTSGFIPSVHSPTAQRLMSGPSSMPSGQAHVYLGE